MTKVILFNYTDLNMLREKVGRLGLKVLDEELEKHGSFTFDIQGASRALTHQLVRHRLASFSQQSQRYVKVTRSYGYLKPPAIKDEFKVPVKLKDSALDLSFEDVMDLTRQVEEGLSKLGVKAEDARYVRPNAATANIVASMNGRELKHFFSLRCASDAQWEIREVAWAMYACSRLVAPRMFGTIEGADSNEYMRQKLLSLGKILEEVGPSFDGVAAGTLTEIPTALLGLSHPVTAFVRKC